MNSICDVVTVSLASKFAVLSTIFVLFYSCGSPVEVNHSIPIGAMEASPAFRWTTDTLYGDTLWHDAHQIVINNNEQQDAASLSVYFEQRLDTLMDVYGVWTGSATGDYNGDGHTDWAFYFTDMGVYVVVFLWQENGYVLIAPPYYSKEPWQRLSGMNGYWYSAYKAVGCADANWTTDVLEVVADTVFLRYSWSINECDAPYSVELIDYTTIATDTFRVVQHIHRLYLWDALLRPHWGSK